MIPPTIQPGTRVVLARHQARVYNAPIGTGATVGPRAVHTFNHTQNLDVIWDSYATPDTQQRNGGYPLEDFELEAKPPTKVRKRKRKHPPQVERLV